MSDFNDTATVSGTVVSIENGADEVGVKSCVVTIPASLSGVSLVTETQTGRNLFNVADYSQIYADRDGVDSYNYRYMIIQLKPNTTYTVSQNSGAYSGTPIILINNALPVGGTDYFDLRKASDTKTYTTDSTGQLYIGSVNSYDDVAYTRLQECKVQIEYGSTAHAYEPYTTPTQYTANLGRTIYGGTADIVTGEGSETWEKKVYTGADNEYWVLSKSGDVYRYYVINDNAKQPTGRGVVYSSIGQYSASGNDVGTCFTYYSSGIQRVLIYYIPPQTIQTVEDFRTWLSSNNFDVVYEKATPEDFTFDGQEVPTRLGYNAFWSDEGDTELTYYKSGYGYTSVTVNRTGTNQWNEELESGSIDGNGNLTVDADKLRSKNYIPVKSGETYYFKVPSAYVLHFWNDAGTYLGYQYKSSEGTHTAPNGATKMKFRLTNDYGTTYNHDISINYPSTDTSYHQYSGVSQTAKLHKVIYGGEVDVINGTAEPKNLTQYTTAFISTANVNVQQLIFSIDLTGGQAYTISCKQSESVSTSDRNTIGIRPRGGSITWENTTANFNPTNLRHVLTYTPPTSGTYEVIFWANKPTTIATYNEWQVEKSNSASEYVLGFTPFTFPPISMETVEGTNVLYADEGDSTITYRRSAD